MENVVRLMEFFETWISMQILSNGYNIFRKESYGCYISNVKLSIGRAREKNLFAI